MKKAIVTGATGLVGTAVARHLSSSGIDVLCIGRRSLPQASIAEILGDGVTYTRLAMEDVASLGEHVAALEWTPGDDCVFFNFAWRGRERLSDGDFSEQLTNAIHAAAAIRSAKQIGCTKFINAGTLEETFVERFLKGGSHQPYQSPQTNYALAKLASRDMCKVVAYLEKIDYVHTRLSVPLARDFSRGTYVASTVKKIIEGMPYDEPENKRPCDLVFLEDVANAYFLIGQSGKNKADYFIGSSKPATLRRYFHIISRLVHGHDDVPVVGNTCEDVGLFDTAKLHRDTGFIATTRLQDVIQAMVQDK